MCDAITVKGNIFVTPAISKVSLFEAVMGSCKVKPDFRTGFHSYL